MAGPAVQASNLRDDAMAGELGRLIERQQPGYALEQPFYCDPDIFRLEQEKVFLKHWLYVGHQSQIPNPGEYFVFEIAQESVIVVRGKDAEIHALVNVCRHRGSRVCKQSSGRVKLFVCPYHGWSYGLDGRLARAWAMPADFDKASHGLHQISCEVFHGLIFINFAGEAGAFEEARKALDDALAPFNLAKTKVAHSEVCRVEANWKLAVENYDECYHCAPSHPEFALSHSIKLPEIKTAELMRELAVQAAKAGLSVDPVGNLEERGRGLSIEFYYDRYALFEGYLTGSEDGQPLAPLLGSLTVWDRGASNLQLGQMSYLLIYSDHAVVYRFTPLALQETEVEIIWLVKETAVEGEDYDLERLTWLWHVTTDADKDIIERNQKGVNSRFYQPGPYSPMEPFCPEFVAWYLEKMRLGHGVPNG